MIAFYLGGMGAKDKNFYVDLLAANGLADEAHEVQDKFLAGDRIGAAMALTAEVIDMCGVACTPAELESGSARFDDAGADSVIAIVFGTDREATIRRLAALLTPSERRIANRTSLGGDQALGLEVGEDLLGVLLRRLAGGLDPDLGVLRLLVGVGDAGELLDLTRAGLRVEALGVALLAVLERGGDEDLDEACRCPRGACGRRRGSRGRARSRR